jgi:hypothetical protein
LPKIAIFGKVVCFTIWTKSEKFVRRKEEKETGKDGVRRCVLYLKGKEFFIEIGQQQGGEQGRQEEGEGGGRGRCVGHSG